MRFRIILIFMIIIVPTFYLSIQTQAQDPIKPSTPTDVYIEEKSVYDAPIGDNRPIMHLSGVLYWERLQGTALSFFINVTDTINSKFWDYETGAEYSISDTCGQSLADSNCVRPNVDRYLILPGGRSFAYTIDAYYDPDIVQDTGFIVIFNSQSVDFSLVVDGETVYAKIDYINTIVLPKGAGLVSYAPIDEGTKDIDKTDDGRYVLSWDYRHRAMDSKHNPLTIEVTYAYDDIYLAFTEQIYQNQKLQRERQQQENRLDLLNASFLIIATLAIVASLISVFFAYLLARKRYEPKLRMAKELPRRAVSDIELNQNMKVPIRSLFMSALIIAPFIFMPGAVNHVTDMAMINSGGSGTDNIANSGLTNINVTQIENDRIQQTTVIDLSKDMTMEERTQLTIPTARDYVYVYVNTSEVNQFHAYDDKGNELNVEIEDNRYKVLSPTLTFSYTIDKPYMVYDNHGMLVFIDRLWSEYYKPAEIANASDPFFHVDLSYSIILPPGSYLYSASPSDLLTIDKTSNGRWNVQFYDEDRRMDAFHDVFTTQVTFSFVDIITALENLNVDFQQQKVKQQQTNDYIEVARDEILLFALLGIIAPLVSFIVAYWVFRRRYQKLIERTEQQQEENIFVEGEQIVALSAAVDKRAREELYKSYIGQYFRLRTTIESVLKKDITIFSNEQLVAELKNRFPSIDEGFIMELLMKGEDIYKTQEAVSYDELYEYTKLVESVIAELTEVKK